MSFLTPDQSGTNLGGYQNPFTSPGVPTTEVGPPASLTEFHYVSQFSLSPVGVVLYVSGTPTDVGTVTVNMYRFSPPGTDSPGNNAPPGFGTPDLVWSTTATEASAGTYQVTPGANNTSVPGYYQLDWTFTLPTTGSVETTSTFLQIGPASPAYDSLPTPMKQMVEDVFVKLADLVDSPWGGPNLQMWYSTHFNRGRIAQLLKQAVQHLNNMGQPYNVWSVDGRNGPMFPVVQWGGLLNSALTIEVIKHLMRSYTEDPEIQGAVQARMSRRDYLARWQSNLVVEQADFKTQLDTWKIANMFKGPKVMVAGGIFPRWGYFRPLGSDFAAWPQYGMRFYV